MDARERLAALRGEVGPRVGVLVVAQDAARDGLALDAVHDEPRAEVVGVLEEEPHRGDGDAGRADRAHIGQVGREAEFLLLRADRDGVAWLTMNRPAQRNALSMELMAAMLAELDSIAMDPAVRVVDFNVQLQWASAAMPLRVWRSSSSSASSARQACRKWWRNTVRWVWTG